MDERSRIIAASTECRNILRVPRYSPERSAALIEWLQDSDAALSDLAGRALSALGPRAFEDLTAYVASPGKEPWPNAVWTLELFPHGHARLLPLLRSWLREATGDLERQCAVSLAHVLVARQRQGHTADPSDVAACRRVLERDAGSHMALRVHLRGLEEGLKQTGGDSSGPGAAPRGPREADQ